MTVNDDKLNELLSGFKPEISNSADFMARLNRSLDVAELARQRIEAARRKNRRAVIIAALAGFAGGVMSTLSYPALERIVASMSVPGAPTLLWMLLSAFTLGLTYAAYDLALTFSEVKH